MFVDLRESRLNPCKVGPPRHMRLAENFSGFVILLEAPAGRDGVNILLLSSRYMRICAGDDVLLLHCR